MQRLEQLKELKELESLIEAQNKFNALVESRDDIYKQAWRMESELSGLKDPSLIKSIPEKDVGPDYENLKNYDKINKPKVPKIRKSIIITSLLIYLLGSIALAWNNNTSRAIMVIAGSIRYMALLAVPLIILIYILHKRFPINIFKYEKRFKEKYYSSPGRIYAFEQDLKILHNEFSKRSQDNNASHLQLDKTLKELDDDIKKIDIDNINARLAQITILPKKYMNLPVLKKLIEYFYDQRVDSIKEAINLYESEKVRDSHNEALAELA